MRTLLYSCHSAWRGVDGCAEGVGGGGGWVKEGARVCVCVCVCGGGGAECEARRCSTPGRCSALRFCAPARTPRQTLARRHALPQLLNVLRPMLRALRSGPRCRRHRCLPACRCCSMRPRRSRASAQSSQTFARPHGPRCASAQSRAAQLWVQACNTLIARTSAPLASSASVSLTPTGLRTRRQKRACMRVMAQAYPLTRSTPRATRQRHVVRRLLSLRPSKI